MASILNVEIPNDKRIIISLTYIYGIGKSLASKILKKANINESKRVKDLQEEEIQKIRDIISSMQDESKMLIEGDLRRDKSLNIKRLMEIRSYRGTRHRKNLPVRGQVTQKNARTRKGPRKTVAGKKGK